MTAKPHRAVLPSWFACAPGEHATFAWIALLHVTAVIGFVALPSPSAPALAAAFAMLFLGGLGTTVAYHRSLAHRALALHPAVEQVLLLAAVLNGSGDAANWVRMHRLHHATSDRPDDISSPHQGRFWWAHLRSLWQADTARAGGRAPDLHRRRYAFWTRAQIPLLAVSLLAGLAWPASSPAGHLSAALWIGPVRLLVALHAQCTIHSVCHLGPVASDRGSSRDVWWLTLLHMGQGENWHGNHHRRPSDPRPRAALVAARPRLVGDPRARGGVPRDVAHPWPSPSRGDAMCSRGCGTLTA